MLAPALALAASVSWGIGDFLGGVRSRIMSPLAILAISQPVGVVLLGVATAIRGSGPPGQVVLWAIPAAALGTIGLACFYRGMAVGAISIVAPLVGASAVIPVVWGLAHGDNTSSVQQAGFVAAIAGVVLTSWERGRGRAGLAAGVGLAAIALVCFGTYFVLMHEASSDDFLWPSFLFRLTSTALVWACVLALRPSFGRARPELPVLVVIGVLDTGGNTLFAAASQHGLVSVVSVLASLYPVVTVLLARFRLRERVQRLQEAGIVLTLAGVALVSAG